jgi:transposase
MLHISRQVNYWLYCADTDMRKGFDSLHGIIKNEMQKEIFDGDIFIFINKRRNQIKLLHWEGDGLSMYYKRLEKGTYEIPEKAESGGSVKMNSEQLQFILSGIVIGSIKKRKRYVYTGNIYNEKSLYNHT